MYYDYLKGPSALSAEQPAFGEVVGGVQTLSPAISNTLMQLLVGRFLMVDSTQPGVGAQNVIAVTPEEYKKAAGIDPTGPNAAELIKNSSSIALANLDDVFLLIQGKPPALLHITLADSSAAAQTYAQSGSKLAAVRKTGMATTTTEEKKGIKPIAFVGAAVGAVVGGLAAGVPGAVIGGLGAGILANQMAA